MVSASKSLIDKSRAEIVDLALKEVREFFPETRAANLVKSTVIKEVHATYSPRPGIDAYRPTSRRSGPEFSSLETGPQQDGPPPWKARSAADIWQRKRWRVPPESDHSPSWFLICAAAGLMRLFAK